MNQLRTYAIALLCSLISLSASADNSDFFTVIIFSDPHLALTGHDGTSVEQMQTYVRNICGMGRAGGKRITFTAAPDYVPTADLVMCLGDMDGDSKDDHNEFEGVMNAFGNAGIPFITMAGNHDYVPEYWTGADGDEGLTGGDSGGIADNEATKTTVKYFRERASQFGCEDMYVMYDGSNHRQPDVFTFRFKGVRFYCGQTYWFQKGYSVNKILSTLVTGIDKMYAPDALINTLDAFVREHANEASVWTQHYPFLAGSDCDRWWLDQNDVGRYIKTDDWSEYGTNDDLGKWTDDARAREFALKKKQRLANIIKLTQNPVHFSGHTHRWAYNDFEGVRDYTVSSTGYSETPGAAYAVLCKEGVGVVQVMRTQFDSASPSVEGQQAYLYNVGTQQYLCGANQWGTQASVGDVGALLTLEKMADGKYTIDTGISNGGDNHYLGSTSLYCDQPPTEWQLQETQAGSKTYLLTTDGTQYLIASAKGKALTKSSASNVKTNTRVHWQLLTRADMIERMSTASPANPVDASFLLAGPDFGRGDTRVGAWEGGATIGGDNKNMCAEWWNANFDVYQLAANIPNGVYSLSCQGFYRAGGGGSTATTRNAMLYASPSLDGSNAVEEPLMAINAGGKKVSSGGYTQKAGNVYVPNSMEDASTVFTAGAYADNSLLVRVESGQLRIGVRKNTLIANDWTIFDRFRLTYLGTTTTYDAINTVETGKNSSHTRKLIITNANASTHTGTTYDMSGRKVTNARTRGVYIIKE